MSRLDPLMNKVAELARETLGLLPASRDMLPAGYLEELRKHVKFSKDDTKFRVIPEPGRGYGIVRCLERGCEDVKIMLAHRAAASDGGKREGIGSLSSYRIHVQEHPTHKANRFARVKAESQSRSGSRASSSKSSPMPPQKPTPLQKPTLTNPGENCSKRNVFSAFDHAFGTPGSSASAPVPKTRPSVIVKAEPYGSSVYSSSPSSSSPMIPRKRYSMGDDTDITVPSPHNSSPLGHKKIKLEAVKAEVRHVPLGPMDANSLGPSSGAQQSSGSLMPEAAKLLLADTDRDIDLTRALLANYQKKGRKTVHDRRRIVKLERRLQTCDATRARCDLALQLNGSAQLAIGIKLPPPPSGYPYGPDVKPFGQQPIASGSKTNSAFPEPPRVASGCNVQLPGLPGVTGGLPNALSAMDPNLMALTNIGLPNYGDTMGHSSAEDYGERFRKDHLAYRDPVADPGDIDKFIIEAGNAESFDGNESVDKALAKLGLTKLGEQLPFMSIALMPHQVIGVAWMCEHEKGSHKGGILADEMGLGKTVQTIATMILNRSDDPAVKTTLICAPLALLDQWKLEIESKTEGALECLIYHGSNKPKLKKDLQKYDVVLTTYQTLALEWPDGRVEERKKRKRQQKKSQDSDDFIDSDSGKEKKAKKKGLLLTMSWYRVVLDEAQNIRNRNTRISLAVTNLDALRRWCLTGTPVTNALADCYAFLRFLEIRPWYDWSDFNAHIAKIEKRRPDLASSRLQAILNACLIRRKKDSMLDGKKLIELLPKDVALRQLIFSQDERDIYNVIEKQSQAIFNKYLRAGTVLKNYSHVLVLLLRLRQICSHPCLIQEGGDAFLRPGEDATVKHEVQTELDRATILAGKEFVAKMKQALKDVVLQRMAAEKASAEAIIEEEECPICFDGLTKPLVTRCGHVFCAECIDTVLNQPAVEDGNEPRYGMSERPCPTCREPIQKMMLFERSAFEPTDADLEERGDSSPITIDSDDDGIPLAAELIPTKKAEASTTAKGKGKAKAKKRFTMRLASSDDDYEMDSDDSDISDFIVPSDEDEEEKDARRELKKKLGKNKRVVLDDEMASDDDEELLPPTVVAKRKGKTTQRFLPSTKMKEMMVLLKEWAETEESKNEKTIVISQWTSCLELVADYLDENGFTFVRYQGNMTRLARDEAVRSFMCQGGKRIMLMSLKCGGVGLNLTRANRVISLDLGWSPAVESQAFDRVHRLGQVRPVTVQRLVIQDTVEARILALQERKQNLADGSLGEGTGKKLGRLSVKDLANLFGLSIRGQLLS